MAARLHVSERRAPDHPQDRMSRTPPTDAPPGTIVTASRDDLHVATGHEGRIAIDRVQLEGGKPLDVREFLAGHRIATGARMGNQMNSYALPCPRCGVSRAPRSGRRTHRPPRGTCAESPAAADERDRALAAEIVTGTLALAAQPRRPGRTFRAALARRRSTSMFFTSCASASTSSCIWIACQPPPSSTTRLTSRDMHGSRAQQGS